MTATDPLANLRELAAGNGAVSAIAGLTIALVEPLQAQIAELQAEVSRLCVADASDVAGAAFDKLRAENEQLRANYSRCAAELLETRTERDDYKAQIDALRTDAAEMERFATESSR